MTPQERSQLLDSLLEGDIAEADFLRIEAELSVDPEVRQEYYRLLRLDTSLARELSDQEAAPQWPVKWAEEHRAQADSATNPTRVRWVKPLLAMLTIAACSMALIHFTPWRATDPLQQALQPLPSSHQLAASGFGVLSGQTNAEWQSPEISDGSLVPAGIHHLRSGLIHLELFSGVQMVIEGEAIFSVDSPMQVSLIQGRARATVPEPAQGFVLKTNLGDVVDLGTEFTVDSGAEYSQVQVVDGEVELRREGVLMQKLLVGERVGISSDGQVLDQPAAAATELIGPKDFQQALALQQSAKFQVAMDSQSQLQQDSRLVAHYRISGKEDWSRQLDNTATARPLAASDGAIVATRRTADRWGRAAGALDFSPTGSRVRVNVPGEFRGLSMFCWVKINSLDRWYNSLFLTDGHEEQEPHWQIMNDGRMFFSVKRPLRSKGEQQESQQYIFYSEPFWNASLSGKWIMLCTTYDVDQRQVTHYLNGRSIGQEAIPADHVIDSIKIGPASLCNWSEPMYRTDPHFVVRNLNGSLDEFAIFEGVLSGEEIANLFHAGHPYSSSGN
ncbi:LamG-like jellyroll fold domain-containing protein [Aureliella helgolandensis]|uniref:FecR protein n=1 Tax=Aureliella helgolandensis TaxID=2527968 RepID=A0A518G8E9_9BACT|nr:LamG-like jellyroll fold domain-containing protein [Aureliella helgolandensis]QDV24853.1 FecR protein [Aureliella helgolandensis]